MIIVRPVFPPLVAMGMSKVGSQSFSPNTSNTLVTGWTPHATYPSSSIVSDRLVAVGAGRANVNLSISYQFANPVKYQIMVNDIEVYSEQFTSASGTRVLSPTTVDLIPGDTVSFVVTNVSTNLSHTVTATNTFMTVIPI